MRKGGNAASRCFVLWSQIWLLVYDSEYTLAVLPLHRAVPRRLALQIPHERPLRRCRQCVQRAPSTRASIAGLALPTAKVALLGIVAVTSGAVLLS